MCQGRVSTSYDKQVAENWRLVKCISPCSQSMHTLTNRVRLLADFSLASKQSCLQFGAYTTLDFTRDQDQKLTLKACDLIGSHHRSRIELVRLQQEHYVLFLWPYLWLLCYGVMALWRKEHTFNTIGRNKLRARLRFSW